MNGLTSLGEMTGIEWLVYNPLVHFAFERSARRNAPPLVAAVHDTWPNAKSLVDVGCGTGRFAAEFQSSGMDVFGLEYSTKLRRQAARRGISVCELDLSKGHPAVGSRHFDLALCTEVAEHIPPQFADTLVSVILKLSACIVFTAAQPGQGGTGHVNEQPREYWIEKFLRAGATYDTARTSHIIEILQANHTQEFMYRNLSVFHSKLVINSSSEV